MHHRTDFVLVSSSPGPVFAWRHPLRLAPCDNEDWKRYLGNPNLPKIGSQHEVLVNLDRDGPRSRLNQHPTPGPGQERPPHDFAPVQKLLVAWSQLTATHDVWWSQFIAILAHSWQILDIPADKSSDFINSSNSLVNISFFNRWSHCHFRDFSTDLIGSSGFPHLQQSHGHHRAATETLWLEAPQSCAAAEARHSLAWQLVTQKSRIYNIHLTRWEKLKSFHQRIWSLVKIIQFIINNDYIYNLKRTPSIRENPLVKSSQKADWEGSTITIWKTWNLESLVVFWSRADDIIHGSFSNKTHIRSIASVGIL